MSEHLIESIEPSESTWDGQQRFRYFVLAVLLPLVAILCSYIAIKTPAQLGAITEVEFEIAFFTSWNATEYWIATSFQLWTSAAMIKCCLSSKTTVPSYVRTTTRYKIVDRGYFELAQNLQCAFPCSSLLLVELRPLGTEKKALLFSGVAKSVLDSQVHG